MPDHRRYRGWLDALVNGDETFGVCDLVLSSFLRIVTKPRVFAIPSEFNFALRYAQRLRESPACALVMPGSRHWQIFNDLCRGTRAAGNHIPDAYLAALAIKSGSEGITSDRDFGRFPGLRWRHPLA